MRMRNVEMPNNANKQAARIKTLLYCLIGVINVMVFVYTAEWKFGLVLVQFGFVPGSRAKYRIASKPIQSNEFIYRCKWNRLMKLSKLMCILDTRS